MRKFLLVLTLALVLTLTACGSKGPGVEPEPEPGEQVSITYWNPLTGADGTVMRQLVRDFNVEYEGEFFVTESYVNEIDHYQNLELLVPMGRGPDVAIMHSHLVQSYVNEELLIPIDKYIENSQVDINPEDYIQDVFNSLYYKEELYGVPLDLHTVGIYYNKTLLEKYDLEVPTTRNEMIAAAKKVQSGENKSNFYGMPMSTVWPSEWIFQTALYQNGGVEIDENSNPAFNSVAGEKAMKAIGDLIHVEKISPSTMGVDQDLFAFQQGNALFHIQGSWMLQAIKEAAVNYEFGVMPLSNMFTEEESATSRQVSARSHTFVVPESRNERSVAKQKAIMTFIKYLGDKSYIWAKAGQIPASNIARNSDEYKALEYIHDFGLAEDFRVAAQSPYFRQAYPIVNASVTELMSISRPGDYTANKIKELLASAEDEANKLLDAVRN